MMTHSSRTHSRHPHHRRDQGAAMVEFAIVAVLLVTLLMGVVSFGMLLSVKNSVTQAANEGARASVSIFAREGLAYADLQNGVSEDAKTLAELEALDRMRSRLAHLESDVGGTPETECSDASYCPDVTSNPSISYLARVHDCDTTDETLLENFGYSVDDPDDHDDCMFTRITYHHGNFRLLPTLPFIDSVLPDDIVDRADVALT